MQCLWQILLIIVSCAGLQVPRMEKLLLAVMGQVSVYMNCIAHKASLWIATDYQNLPLMRALLRHGADVENPKRVPVGNRPLHIAAQHNFVPGMVLLLRHGANPNSRNTIGLLPLEAIVNPKSTQS